MSLSYRPAKAPDLPFIVAGILDSLRTSRSAGLIQMPDWYPVMGPQLMKVLTRPGVTAHVAYHVGESDGLADLAGFIVTESDYEVRRTVKANGRHFRRVERTDVPLVIWVYVKKAYRGLKLAKGLLKSAGVGMQLNYAVEPDDRGLLAYIKRRYPAARLENLVIRFPKGTNESQA